MKLFKLPILGVLLFLTTTGIAQTFKATPAQTAALKKQADDAATAMMKQDYKQMVYYTYPKIVEQAGGADKMQQRVTMGMGQMQGMGIAFKSVTVGDVKQIVKSGTHLYSVIQDIIQVSNNGTLITGSSYLLAVSANKGKRWYFVQSAPLKNQKLKQLFPDYPSDLVIPETHMPSMGGN
jgi:hypothetical protein